MHQIISVEMLGRAYILRGRPRRSLVLICWKIPMLVTFAVALRGNEPVVPPPQPM
jgi:hypothetical protein